MRLGLLCRIGPIHGFEVVVCVGGVRSVAAGETGPKAPNLEVVSLTPTRCQLGRQTEEDDEYEDATRQVAKCVNVQTLFRGTDDRRPRFGLLLNLYFHHPYPFPPIMAPS